MRIAAYMGAYAILRIYSGVQPETGGPPQDEFALHSQHTFQGAAAPRWMGNSS